MIYWFTGQPGHGKTVLANKLQNYIEYTTGYKVFRVDGDDLRALTINKDYSREGRLKNVKTAQDISLYLHNQGTTVITSLVSPYQSQRKEFKDFVGDGIRELYIHTTEIRGRENYHAHDYEPPVENFIDVDTTCVTEDESLHYIIKQLNLEVI